MQGLQEGINGLIITVREEFKRVDNRFAEFDKMV